MLIKSLDYQIDIAFDIILLKCLKLSSSNYESNIRCLPVVIANEWFAPVEL